MPKRKRSDDLEKDLGHLMRKIKKLERKVRKKTKSCEVSVGDSVSDVESLPGSGISIQSVARQETHSHLAPETWSPDPYEQDPPESDIINQPIVAQCSQDIPTTIIDSSESGLKPTTSKDPQDPGQQTHDEQELGSDILNILGDDPSSTKKYGACIRKELAPRFQHIVQNGLNREDRKALLSKYLVPSNCTYLDAPSVNPEIKAALPDSALKRDKGIQAKQTEIASALSCLGEIITTCLNSKEKDNELIQKLMDANRLLCDVQYHHSATRRTCILNILKKDLKEHLLETKIDTFLFGETLAETLKSAKAVNKSGIELKADPNIKRPAKKMDATASKPLNQRAPAPVRRQLGSGARRRQPAYQPTHLTQYIPPPAPAPMQTANYNRTQWGTRPPPSAPTQPPRQGRRRY